MSDAGKRLIAAARDAARLIRNPPDDAQDRIAEAQRRQCRHVFEPVLGTTAYLRCPKCGARCDND